MQVKLTDCSVFNSSAGDASVVSLAVHTHGIQSRSSVCLSVISNQEPHPVATLQGHEQKMHEVLTCLCCHWKAEFKSFTTVCNTPISLIIGMSYTVGKLLTSAYQCLEVCKRVTAYSLCSCPCRAIHKLDLD